MEKPPAPREPPIHTAARVGDLVALACLVSNGSDVNQRADIEVDNGDWLRGLTPLMTAARSTDGSTVETLRWLLSGGADLRAVSEAGVTAAWYAAGKGGRWWFHDWRHCPDQVERLRFLLDAGLDPREAGYNGRSLLTEACGTGDAARAQLLLDRGVLAEPEYTPEANNQQWKSMIASVRSKMIDGAADILADTRRDALDSYQIPLFEAAMSDSEACVAALIRHGADVSRVDSSGRTALAHVSSAAAARVLLEAGASIHAASMYGDDVLDSVLTGDCCCESHCSVEERARIADVLVDSGAKLERADEYGQTRLRRYSFKHAIHAVEFMLARHSHSFPDLNEALFGICWQGEQTDPEMSDACERIIRVLVAAGANVNARGERGWTPLLEAIAGDWSSPTAVRVLLALGANPNQASTAGTTPLMMAGDQACRASIEMLLNGGAKPDLRDEDGRTALDWAQAHLEVWKGIVASPPDVAHVPGEATDDQATRRREALKKAVEAEAFLRTRSVPGRSWIRRQLRW